MQVVGSRGDVQPFVALGKTLRERHGHRVRVATHSTFKSLVEENGLEFFNIGGHPEDLMAFMVSNPRLVPEFKTLRTGGVTKQRARMYEIFKGCWRSCIEAGDGMNAHPSTEDYSTLRNGIDSGVKSPTNPFVANAISSEVIKQWHALRSQKMFNKD